MTYKLIAQFRDDDHAWPVTIWSHYETIQDAQRAGYEFIKKYSGGFPRIDFFRIEPNG